MALDVWMVQEAAESQSRAVVRTMALCWAAAALEGFVFQAVGVAAGRLVHEFQLSPASIGWIASSSTLALLPGAIVGGELADRLGRKRVLATGITLMGLFTLLTTLAQGRDSLLVLRFLAGLGLGAALPNLIALSAESAPPQSRCTYVGIMYCGIPGGGALASLVAILGGGVADWRLIFCVGGALALLVAPALAFALPESRAYQVQRLPEAAAPRPERRGRSGAALFGEGRTGATLLLWVALFIEMLLIYVMVNWLPTLLTSKGFTALHAGILQVVFNVGGLLGNLLYGWLMDRGARAVTALTMYGCVIAVLVALANVHGYAQASIVVLAVGLFTVGGQLVLYALLPGYYPTRVRSTGVGWAVAIARIGSFVGPVIAGQLLQAGVPASRLIGSAAPVLAVAAIAVLALLRRPLAAA